MTLEHAAFFLVVTLPLILILWIERKNVKKYVYLGVFTVILAAVWEPIGAYIGLWYYVSQPQFFGVSVLTLLLYFHWVSFSYFLGNRVSGRFKK